MARVKTRATAAKKPGRQQASVAKQPAGGRRAAASQRPATSKKVAGATRARPRLGTRFDFAALRTRIIDASVRALAEVRRQHPGDPVCAFALYSDEGAMTVCPAMDLASARAARLAGDPDDAADAAFSPAEWALESVGAERAFNAICDEVGDHVSTHPEQFEAFRDALFETCLQALEVLRDRAVFGRGADVLLQFAVSDAELRPRLELRRLTRLMGPRSPHVAAFRRWIRTWSA